MPVEIHVFTSNEFVRVGAHGELDWNTSRALLASLAKAFVARGTNLAILDVRDAAGSLTDEQIVALVHVLGHVGFGRQHRLAVLHRPRPNPKADIFAAAAVNHGFDVGSFDDYEVAAEWLSASRGEDPDFDRETYKGPGGRANPGGAQGGLGC